VRTAALPRGERGPWDPRVLQEKGRGEKKKKENGKCPHSRHGWLASTRVVGGQTGDVSTHSAGVQGKEGKSVVAALFSLAHQKGEMARMAAASPTASVCFPDRGKGKKEIGAK